MKGLSLARVHFELASMYQQAAMMHSYSIIHLYGTKETTAMVECLYLRGVAHAVLGEKEKGCLFLQSLNLWLHRFLKIVKR